MKPTLRQQYVSSMNKPGLSSAQNIRSGAEDIGGDGQVQGAGQGNAGAAADGRGIAPNEPGDVAGALRLKGQEGYGANSRNSATSMMRKTGIMKGAGGLIYSSKDHRGRSTAHMARRNVNRGNHTDYPNDDGSLLHKDPRSRARPLDANTQSRGTHYTTVDHIRSLKSQGGRRRKM